MEDYLLTNRVNAVKSESYYQMMLSAGKNETEAEAIRDIFLAKEEYLDAAFSAIDAQYENADAPISYTYPKQEEIIGNLVRIAHKRIMISVSSRLGALPYLANPLQKHQFILDKNSKNGWIQ